MLFASPKDEIIYQEKKKKYLLLLSKIMYKVTRHINIVQFGLALSAKIPWNFWVWGCRWSLKKKQGIFFGFWARQ